MTLRKNKSTPESRDFWDFVEKKAAESRNDHSWQRGAVIPPERENGSGRTKGEEPRRSGGERR
jgi:hypothetical protein